MNNSKSAVANFIFEGISVDTNHLFGLLWLLIIPFLAVKGNRWMFLLFVEDFVNGNSMSLGENISIFSFSVKLGGVLLQGNWFDRFYFLHVEGLALIVEFLIFGEWLSHACLVVKTDFLWVFVGLGLDPTARLVPTSPYLDFQISYHLNDHYYIPKNSYSILLHHNYTWRLQNHHLSRSTTWSAPKKTCIKKRISISSVSRRAALRTLLVVVSVWRMLIRSTSKHTTIKN